MSKLSSLRLRKFSIFDILVLALMRASQQDRSSSQTPLTQINEVQGLGVGMRVFNIDETSMHRRRGPDAKANAETTSGGTNKPDKFISRSFPLLSQDITANVLGSTDSAKP
mmetsp:Transcript_23045/g.36029  ORF Transcript_23045/g.36029 Transcript_23045/m.36029 type:complete len:111 (+) Transcript_23045:2162-2494(+)